MPDKREKVIEILALNGELSMVKLIEKSEVRRNDVFKLIPKMEKEKIVRTRIEGREKLVRLYSPIKKTNYFITNYPKRLKYFEKSLETQIKALEKNKPLVSKTNFPFTKIKIKQPVLELDKKRKVYRDMGKTRDSYALTFKTRPTARKHFDNILVLLNKLYQESSVLNFANTIIDDDTLLREYQKKSEKLIRNTTKKIENIFPVEVDQESLTFVIWQMRNVLHGLVFKATLEKEMKS